eukprot:gnl/MRDRNA2_/MRDRNA2_98342_c0_seq1.p1 gnl/MRDRNA2_/MRDRNA2_98342_c0~~gnl/MRDRNA2_/MRDRNA2_98342_c0_seq1.p1  ORF type:complete len:260 (+),score=95.99 gnl/MRDRNA2_/MRDRNA2_98342_c0_seq1:83-862(+)
MAGSAFLSFDVSVEEAKKAKAEAVEREKATGEEESNQGEETSEGASKSPFLSFDAIATPSSVERAKTAAAEARERKKKRAEEEAKQKEEEEAARKASGVEKEDTAASKKAREGVAAWKQEQLATKRKANAEEAKRLMKKAKKEPKTEFAGGFMLNEKVEAVADLKVKGEVIVKGSSGTILGPAEIDPKEKLNVQFAKLSVTLPATEIKRPGGLPGGKEKPSSKPDTEKINKWLRQKKYENYTSSSGSQNLGVCLRNLTG